MKHDEQRTPERAARDREPKRPYTPPRLIEYGSVAKLTQSGGSTVQADGINTFKKMVCL
jgi:hypothetical protein